MAAPSRAFKKGSSPRVLQSGPIWDRARHRGSASALDVLRAPAFHLPQFRRFPLIISSSQEQARPMGMGKLVASSFITPWHPSSWNITGMPQPRVFNKIFWIVLRNARLLQWGDKRGRSCRRRQPCFFYGKILGKIFDRVIRLDSSTSQKPLS